MMQQWKEQLLRIPKQPNDLLAVSATVDSALEIEMVSGVACDKAVVILALLSGWALMTIFQVCWNNFLTTFQLSVSIFC